MPLVLIGYRGAGKTTVARELALRTGWDWVDSDVEVELRAGESIAAIFAEEGETAFRDLEAAVTAELLGRGRTVIALGGGAVLRPENRAILATAAAVVWLKAQPETIHERLAADASTESRRPDLSVGGIQEIRETLAQREPLYRQCAGLEIDTDEKTAAAVAAEIVARLAGRVDFSRR